MIGFGRYNLLVRIGRGGMGMVWLARQKALGRFCAIKLLDPFLAKKPGIDERFVREARAAASLSHPNLVSVFDGDVFDGQHFIAMEYVEGYGLADIIQMRGPVPLPLALRWLQQAAVALEYVHGKGLIHRDVKPHNMLISADGTLKLMDLGLATDTLDTQHALTMTGDVIGSPSYISPEQIQDAKTVDARADLYSLGISFYQMLTGKLPFERTSAAAVCVAHLQDPMPSVQLPDASLTAALDQFIARLTAKKRDERFQSAREVLAALEPWLERHPLDESTAAYLAAIPFQERSVRRLLEAEGIEMKRVDDDLTPLPPGGMTARLHRSGPDATTILEATAAGSRRPVWLWLGGGMLLGAVLVGGTVFITLKMVLPQIAAQWKARANPSPPPTEAAARQQQRRAFAEQLFADARRCPEAEWPRQKQQLLDKIRTHLQHQARVQDPVVLERFVATMGTMLDDARAMSPAEYQQVRLKLIERWMSMGRRPAEKPKPAAPPPPPEPQ